jgi:hypothetical protein
LIIAGAVAIAIAVHAIGTESRLQWTPWLLMALILFLCTIFAKPWGSSSRRCGAVKRSNHPINTVD